MNRLVKAFGHLLTGTSYLSVLLICCMTVFTVYEVIMRYFVGKPTSWTLEISSYMLLALVLIGAAWLLREEGHVRIEILFSHLSPRRQFAVNLITSCLGCLACGVLLWKGIEVTADAYQKAFVIAGPLDTPRYLVLGWIPAGALLLSIQFARRAWQNLGPLRKPEEN